MIIPGIYASAISGHLTPAGGGSFDALMTYTVPSGGISSVTFVGIPTGYQHLQIRAMGIISGGGYDYLMNLNSDSGSNYAIHRLYGNGSSVGSQGFSSQTSTNSGGLGNQPSALIMDILDYSNNNKYKTLRSLSGYDANGSGSIWLCSNLWMNTAAVSTIAITNNYGNFNQYSTFTLYGVR